MEKQGRVTKNTPPENGGEKTDMIKKGHALSKDQAPDKFVQNDAKLVTKMEVCDNSGEQ